MEGFEHDGVFWFPDQPDVQIAGKLTFEPAEGVTLALFGSFAGLSDRLSQNGAPVKRIHGVAGKNEITLDECSSNGTNVQMPGIVRETFHARRALFGVLLDPDEDLILDQVEFELDQLSNWVNRTGIEVRIENPEQDSEAVGARLAIEYHQLPQETATGDGREIGLDFSWTLTTDRLTSAQVGQATSITIAYSRAVTLESIMADVNNIQGLVTLSVDTTTVATEISVGRADITRQLGPNRTAPQQIKLFTGDIAEHTKASGPQPGHKMFFHFDQIGGLPTVALWVDVARRYRAVLGSLMTLRYSVKPYEENRYTNALSAAETLHRIRFSNELLPRVEYRSLTRKLRKAARRDVGPVTADWLSDQLRFSNEPRLKQRLVELTEYASPAFLTLVGDADSWAATITGLRNRLTHHDSTSPIARIPGDAYFLAESVYILVMICLLRECEVPPEILQSINDNRRVTFLRTKLQEIVPRIHGSLYPNKRR